MAQGRQKEEDFLTLFIFLILHEPRIEPMIYTFIFSPEPQLYQF
jgi:hypothetical protein